MPVNERCCRWRDARGQPLFRCIVDVSVAVVNVTTARCIALAARFVEAVEVLWHGV